MELDLHDHRDVYNQHPRWATSSVPSIYIPPWAGGESLRGVPLGLRGADPPKVHPSDPASFVSIETVNNERSETGVTTVCSPGTVATSTNCSTICESTTATRRGRDGQEDLGHCDHLLGHRDVEVPGGFHELVPRLQHRYIENLHHGSEVRKLLHSVPLDPLLLPWLLTLTGWRRPAGLSFVQAEELWLEEGGGSSRTTPCASTRASSLALAVFWRCALWCVNVAKAAAIRLLLVSPPRAQSSLLSPLGSSCDGLPAEVHQKR